MKQKFITLLTALFLATGAFSQTPDSLKIMQRDSIISQIEKQLHIPFEASGVKRGGYARVGIVLTDSSTIHITEINSESYTIESYLEADLEGMKVDAREEDLESNGLQRSFCI